MALYQWQIIVFAFFCVSVTLLIVWLIIQRSRHGRSKDSLRTSEERYLLALAGSTDGLWDWDILSDTVFYSDRFREILGYSSEEFAATIDSFRSRLHPEDAEPVNRSRFSRWSMNRPYPGRGSRGASHPGSTA